MIILIVGTLHASLRMPAVPVLLIMHFKYRENHKDALFCILVSGSAFLILLASYFLPFPGNSQAHVLTAEFPCLLTYSIPVWGADLTGETTFTSILSVRCYFRIEWSEGPNESPGATNFSDG